MKNITQQIRNLELAVEREREKRDQASSLGACIRSDQRIAGLLDQITKCQEGFISRYGVNRCYMIIRRHGGIETFYYENMKDLRFHEDALDDVADELPYELVEIFDATEVIG